VRRILIFAAAAALAGLTFGPVAAAQPRLDRLIDRYMARAGDRDALLGAALGVPVGDPGRLPDWSPQRLGAIAAEERQDQLDLRGLRRQAFSPQAQTDAAILQERLAANLQQQVCRTELWDVSHVSGWPALFTALAASQPVGTPAARAAALARWSGLPDFVDVDIANLRRGLDLGYSAPRPVVERVIRQVDGLAAAPAAASPYASPALRDDDPAFRAAFLTTVTDRVQPALKRYGAFLKNEYLPRARATLAVADLPDGRACYRALLRANTTLDRDPAKGFAAGQRAVAANRQAVMALGGKLFGLADFNAIVARSRARPEDHFQSQAELLAYTRAVLAKAKAVTRTLVEILPDQDVAVEPEAPFEEAAGAGSHYVPNPDPAKPGVFRLQMKNWATQTRADAAITAVHEAWPGHHLQIALARQLRPASAFERLAFNAAYVEGWGRTAEAFGETAGIYDSEDAAILRRVWPARGMVLDPGLHIMGWSRDQAVAYILASGKFSPGEAEDLVDRVAAMPGQLAAYDTGALEIERLRREAQARLGARFDLRGFNGAVLDEGVVPLERLRERVAAWVAAQAR
jgi:uncharacterized protein (DUF885 family)